MHRGVSGFIDALLACRRDRWAVASQRAREMWLGVRRRSAISLYEVLLEMALQVVWEGLFDLAPPPVQPVRDWLASLTTLQTDTLWQRPAPYPRSPGAFARQMREEVSRSRFYDAYQRWQQRPTSPSASSPGC